MGPEQKPPVEPQEEPEVPLTEEQLEQEILAAEEESSVTLLGS